MKKFLLLLGMVTCLIGTAACGKADQVQESQLQIDEASLINYSDQVVNALNEIVTGGMQISMQATRLSAPAFPAGNRRCPIWVHIME